MEFNKSIDWLKESDEENLLADDELDAVDEELNEGLYVDPANYDKHDDLVDVVDKTGNPQKMTQATYDKNKDLGEFTAKEPEKKEIKVGKKVAVQDLKEDKAYVSKEDIFYGNVEDIADDEEYVQSLKDKGLVNDKNEVVIPAGTNITFKGHAGGAYVFDVNGEEIDMSMDDVDLYEADAPALSKEEKDFIEKTKKEMPYAKIVKHPEHGVLAYTPDDGTLEDVNGKFYNIDDFEEDELDLVKDSDEVAVEEPENNPYDFSLMPGMASDINAVTYANHEDYDDMFEYFIKKVTPSNDEYAKLIYRLADGYATANDLDSKSAHSMSLLLKALEDNDIDKNIFARRIQKAVDDYNRGHKI